MKLRAINWGVASVLLGLIGCAPEPETPKSIQTVAYAGFFNTIEGQLSDGSEFSGVGWFLEGSRRGDFCVNSGDLVCSGTYGGALSLVIKGTMVCSNGVSGDFVTERIKDRGFLTPIDASGTLSDGRTATATFGAMQQGRGTATCFR